MGLLMPDEYAAERGIAPCTLRLWLERIGYGDCPVERARAIIDRALADLEKLREALDTEAACQVAEPPQPSVEPQHLPDEVGDYSDVHWVFHPGHRLHEDADVVSRRGRVLQAFAKFALPLGPELVLPVDEGIVQGLPAPRKMASPPGERRSRLSDWQYSATVSSESLNVLPLPWARSP